MFEASAAREKPRISQGRTSAGGWKPLQSWPELEHRCVACLCLTLPNLEGEKHDLWQEAGRACETLLRFCCGYDK